jgi:microfibrillar-associated protein 1
MATAQRKQAPRLPRPAARYWKGKAPKGVAELESDSDEEPEQQLEDGDVLIKDAGDINSEGNEEDNEEMRLSGVRVDLRKKGSMNITLKDVSVSKEGKVIVAGRLESGKTEMETGGTLITDSA